METCIKCNFETDDLFAPFDKGVKDLCSDCQMETENEINENQMDDYLKGVGPAWEGYQ